MWRGGGTSEGEYEKIRPTAVERAEIKIDDVAKRSRVSGTERVHKLVVVLGQRVVVVVGYVDLVVVDVVQGWWESRSAWHRAV